MAISIRQMHPVFVGEVSGVDLRCATIAGATPTAEQVAA